MNVSHSKSYNGSDQMRFDIRVQLFSTAVPFRPWGWVNTKMQRQSCDFKSGAAVDSLFFCFFFVVVLLHNAVKGKYHSTHAEDAG